VKAMNKSVFTLLFLILPLIHQETLTITTYYPAPYGVYRTLRLYPTTNPDPTYSCSNEGEIYTYDFDNQLYFCNGSNWQSLTSYWTFDSTNNWLYPNNTNWNVGIGTTSPGDKLDVNGDIRVRGADIKDAGGTARITLTDNGRLDLKEDGGSTSQPMATSALEQFPLLQP
jgi:hypothetical protein